jgi:orotate phosphoribosyltransferase
MVNPEITAPKIADYLLQIKAIELRPETPYTWASGWKSPIYCDNRKTLSYPNVRTLIKDSFVSLIEDKMGTPDVIAGVATGGIGIGALVADKMNLPFIYIRSSVKGHGMQNRIEGVLNKGQKVVVIEDLVSTGKSSLEAVDAIREAGGEIVGMTSIFTYGFEVARKAFEVAKCKLYPLTEYNRLIEKAIEANYIDRKDLDTLKEWRLMPDKWKQ